jgi:hypothetical protein
MKETQINELQGTSILTKSFFNKLIRRIECTKPLAGSGITISEEENGFKISGGGGADGGSTSTTYNSITFNVVTINVITLNVCSNGTPDIIYVLSTEDSNSSAVTMLTSPVDAPFQVLIPNQN